MLTNTIITEVNCPVCSSVNFYQIEVHENLPQTFWGRLFREREKYKERTHRIVFYCRGHEFLGDATSRTKTKDFYMRSYLCQIQPQQEFKKTNRE